MDIQKMHTYLKDFTAKRNWDPYRTPKNLVMALSVEVAELTELFQWLTEKESYEIKNNEEEITKVKNEVADILSYLLQFADSLDIDLEKAFWEKTPLNEKKHREKK